MSAPWAAISVPLQPEALDDVTMTLHGLVGNAFAVESRPDDDAPWPITARAYVAPGAGQKAARRGVLRALHMLRLAGGGVVGEASETFVGADDYLTSWRAAHAPLRVGRRLVVVPPWLDPPADAAHRIPLVIEAGMAFGTGRHPTTQLALEALETCVARGDRVADVGAGSGILAIAAAKLGAARVTAFEQDPQARPTAEANLRANGAADRVTLVIPSRQRSCQNLRRSWLPTSWPTCTCG